MSRLLTLLLVILGSIAAPCYSIAETTSEFTAPGVSKALAEYRRANIFCVQYRLHFSIPEQGPISGNASITYELESPTDVILDFKASNAPIVTIPSAPTTAKHCTTAESSKIVRYENEHIIIPAALTTAGVNSIAIEFTPDDQSFNRRESLLYTLFVPDRARTAFPCFDQPDMKARFTLSLEVPEGWKAVSNTAPVSTAASAATQATTAATQATVPEASASVRNITFAESEPLPTYLFAFAAGRFNYQQHTTADGRNIGAYYCETDPKRIAQLPEIFRQVEHSLCWQEDFTGIKYPFAKYDLVILPGFQFGGMEHTGATFYNDNTIFLSEHPTPDELLSRASLIAHETSHMWFGDFVTMRWFDDVWTKEVFANYFAAEITRPLFPDVNHDLNRLKTYAAAALSEDRTWTTPVTLRGGETLRGGGTAIRQPLDNLRDAGLVYNQIIYNKAPLMMQKLVDIMGHDAFRESIREYVATYAYGNATWDQLVAIFDRHTPADVQAFSRAWVNEKGMPHISLHIDHLSRLSVNQTDPYERGLTWPQSFAVTLHTAKADSTIVLNLTDAEPTPVIPLQPEWADALIIPNTDGRGYGIFLTDKPQLDLLLQGWQTLTTGTARQAVLMNLHENYLIHRFSDDQWANALVTALAREDDPLTASTICSYLSYPLLCIGDEARFSFLENRSSELLLTIGNIEEQLRHLATTHPLTSVRTQIYRLLMHVALRKDTVAMLYEEWLRADNPLLSERDYMNLSYELAIRIPTEAEHIVDTQRQRLTDPNRINEYNYVSRAVIPYRHHTEQVFNELLNAEGRRIEPWAASVLRLLNHPLRDNRSTAFIRPALEVLEEVQRTGDIFFPANWTAALLGQHIRPEARQEVINFLNDYPDFSPLLRNKILNASYGLMR